MSREFNRGDSIFIPFCDGKTVTDSQLMPRMYKTVEAFRKYFPDGYLKRNAVELAEFTEVVHGRWIHQKEDVRGISDHQYVCSVCGHLYWNARIPNFKYCPNCGADMRERKEK